MPGGPANIETHEIVRSARGGWNVVPVGAGERLWVRGGQTVWGPFALGPALTRLERLPVGALARVELSVDGTAWVPLQDLLQSRGLSLLSEDVQLPAARIVARLQKTSLTALLGELERRAVSGRLVVVHDGPHGPERRELWVVKGKLAGVRSNSAALREAVHALTGRDATAERMLSAGQQLSEMFTWQAGRAYFDEAYAPEAAPTRPLTWMLPRRLSRTLTPERLAHALAPSAGKALVRHPDFDAQVARMGLLGWELTVAEAFGHGRSLERSLGALHDEPRIRQFALAFAHVMVELKLLLPA
jgi:hypothetical protein